MAIYALMHKDIKVLTFDFLPEQKIVKKIISIEEPERVPPGIIKDTQNGKDSESMLKELDFFLQRRDANYYLLPEYIRDRLQGSTIKDICRNENYTDINDKYWIKEEGNDVPWENIDPIANFVLQHDAIYNLMFNPKPEEVDKDDLSFGSVNTLRDGFIWNKFIDNRSGGHLMAQMYVTSIEEYKRHRKALEADFKQLAVKELMIIGDRLFCTKITELDEDTEAIRFSRYMNSFAYDNTKTYGENVKNCCLSLFGADYEGHIDAFLGEVIKYNEMFQLPNGINNLYVIRDFTTLKLLGFRGL